MHPQLNRLTPYDLGGDYDSNGAWQGGWMELVEGAETMALDGGHGSRDGRPPMCGITPVDEQRIYYYVLWPQRVPVDPPGLPARPPARAARRRPHDRSSATGCSRPTRSRWTGFDPKEAIEFWDVTNRQDWHVCELQQRGTASRSWVAGRYSDIEPSVQAFDLMVADRYAGDGVVEPAARPRQLRRCRTTMTTRPMAPTTPPNGNGNGHAPDRAAARRRERTGVATD